MESARILLLQARLSRATESALNSTFAGYDGDLFDEFGVLLLNTTDLPGYSSIEDLVESYLKKELETGVSGSILGGNLFQIDAVDVDVVSTLPVTYRGGEVFVRSVMDYMKYALASGMVSTIMGELELLEEGERVKEEINKKQEGEADAADQIQGEQEKEEYKKMAKESVIEKIKALQKEGYLELILPDNRIVSARSTTRAGFPSSLFLAGAQTSQTILEEIGERILYSEYILKHFNSFVEEKGNQTLQYEIEYILFGNDNDRKNIEQCVRRLLLVREGMNILTIYRTPELKRQAEMYASALVGWTGIAPLVEVVQAAATGVWAFGEAIVDVRTLLGGAKVPLLKNAGEWTLRLDQLPQLLDRSFFQGGDCESGLVYADYLRLLLLLMDEKDGYYRTMDMIQCRLSDYKPRFFMQECVYDVQIKARVNIKPLFLRMGRNRYAGSDGYEITVSASRMY